MTRKPSKVLSAEGQYCLLTTFGKDGRSVSTIVWYAVDKETVWVATRSETGKVKRIRNGSEVDVAQCDSIGHPKGPPARLRATVLESSERGRRALLKKYGLKKRLMDWALRFSKRGDEVFLKLEARE